MPRYGNPPGRHYFNWIYFFLRKKKGIFDEFYTYPKPKKYKIGQMH